MKKALITGVSGFVGPYLKENLEMNGYEVFSIDRKAKIDKHSRKCDLLDKNTLFETIKDFSPEVIFHLASQSSVHKSFQEPELTEKINVEGTKNLLDAVIAAKLRPVILIVSSGEVYGDAQGILDEKSDLHPLSPYAESRVNQERLALAYDLDIVIARSFNHTGPKQPPHFSIPNFAKQIAEIEKGKKDPILLTGNLEAKRDFSDVRDIVVAYRLLVEKGKPKQIYNVCSGTSISIRDCVSTMLSHSTAKIQVKIDQSRIRPKDLSVIIASHAKLSKHTGWSPKIPFDSTITDVLNYWRNSI